MTATSRILGVVLVLAVVLAVADAFWPAANSGSLDLPVSLCFALCAFAWVRADANARQIEAPRGSALIAALIIPVGVPLYLFRALGFRQGFLATLKALGFLSVVVLVYVLASYAAEFVARIAA